MYRLRGVRRRFGDAIVLDVPALDLEKGAIHFFVGPNGAGKTMMLRVLSLLERPDEGEVEFGGARVFPGPSPEMLRRVTVVAQDPYLFDAKVLANAAYGLRRRGLPRKAAEAAAREALDRVGLGGFEGRQARTLSGGEGKRLAIARALAPRPDVLLLDEPLANVDAANVRIIESLLRDIHARPGATIVATTHDLDQPYRLGARVLSLHKGRVSDAPPDNVFHGVIEGSRMRIGRDVEVSLVGDHAGPAAIAIDARAVFVSRAPLESSARNHFAGPITAMQSCGEHVRLTVDIGVPLAAWITPASLRESNWIIGDRVVLSFKATSVRVY